MTAWYRSWPEAVPDGRAYVVDSLPRLVMRDCNYATITDYQPWPVHEPGWCMLEWDVALDAHSRARFVEHALADPTRILVAPYMLYPDGQLPRVVHRERGRPIPDGQPRAEMFGLGCIYFPQALLNRFWDDPPPMLKARSWLSDGVIGDWHRARYDPVEVDWTVHPQHLHGD